MKKNNKYDYDLEIFKHDIPINAETYSGDAFAPPFNQNLIWDSEEGKILPISDYVKNKKVKQRKSKIEKIKKKL